MKEVVTTISRLSSCLVCVKPDMLEDAVVALSSEEAEVVLGYSEVTTRDVVKEAAYIVGCPPTFYFEAEIWFVELMLMVFSDLRFIRQV